MKRPSVYLEDAIGLLIEHFGIARVKSAVARTERKALQSSNSLSSHKSNEGDRRAQPTVTSILQRISDDDPEKYRLLAAFYKRLTDKKVLPESQDIRQYAQNLGSKDIRGKSRRELASSLMLVLVDRSTERLRDDIRSADSVSEEQRKQGFSILTDKLLDRVD